MMTMASPYRMLQFSLVFRARGRYAVLNWSIYVKRHLSQPFILRQF